MPIHENAEWLKSVSDLYLVGSGLNKMRSAKGREEIIHPLFVSKVHNGKLQFDSPAIGAPEQVICTDGEVEHISGGDSWRIVIIVRGARDRDLHSRGTVHSR